MGLGLSHPTGNWHMRTAKGLLAAGLFFFGGLLCLWASGCHDKPTEPRPVTPKDYVLYWAKNVDDSTFYAYHTTTGEIDSFNMPGTRIYDMNVSADGDRVYISYSDKTRVVRVLDFTPIVDLPYSGWYGVAVSPDNRFVAIQSNLLRIVCAHDYSVVYQDTLPVYRGIFSFDGRHLYAPGPTTPCRSVYRLDLDHGFKSDFICVPDDFMIYRIVPSTDEKLLFMFRSLGNCYMFFDIFDVASDSLLFRDPVAPGCGDMVASPDNQYLYFTGPGDLHGWPPPAYSVARYGVKNITIDSILWSSVCKFDFPTGIVGSDLALTPDGRTLAVVDGLARNRLLFYDTQLGDTARVLCRPGDGFWHVTCQNGR